MRLFSHPERNTPLDFHQSIFKILKKFINNIGLIFCLQGCVQKVESLLEKNVYYIGAVGMALAVIQVS